MMCLLAALILGVAGCGGNAAKDDKRQPRPKRRNLSSGRPFFCPFEFPSEEADKPTGFDMELIEAIGKKMGYEKSDHQRAWALMP